jgi:hypothetical protein
MSIEKFLKDPKVVDIVLNTLSKHIELPEEGFLAGGSVANTLFGLYHTGNPNLIEVNDIDVFKLVTDKEVKVVDGVDETLNPPITLNLNIFNDDYGHVYVERDGTYYRVLNSERDGKLNNVTCIVVRGNGIIQERFIPEEGRIPVSQNVDYGKINFESDYDIILRGFDINNCQVGIDLKTKKLHYTKPYKEFLKTKQLMVDVPYTPLHTAIRLIKKTIQYKGMSYCDFDTELKYLYQATRTDEYGKLIGKETYDKYVKYRKTYVMVSEKGKFFSKMIDLDNYFSLKRTIFEEKPKDYFGIDYNAPNYVNPEISELWSCEPVKGYCDYIDVGYFRINELKRVWELLYRPKKKSQVKKIDKILRFKRLEEGTLFSNESKTKYIYSKEIHTYNSYLSKCLIANDDYYDCDFDFKHMVEIENFFSEHRRLVGLFFKCKNLQEQYEKLRLLKTFIKKEGEWVVGALENAEDIELNEETIIELIDKEKSRLSEPLCEPYDLSGFKYKNYVTELLTPLDLKQEGYKMGHCVGGYSSNVENGLSRIFHIEIDGVGSTVEIGIKTNKNYYWVGSGKESDKSEKCFNIKQHYGRYPEKGNLRPLNKNRGIAFKLCYYLAGKNLTEEEFIESMKIGDNKWSKWLKDGHRTLRGTNTYNVNPLDIEFF